MGLKFEFDESVSKDIRKAVEKRRSAIIDPSNLLVGDLVRLYPEGGGKEHTFRCVARRHDIIPDGPIDEDDDAADEARLVYILGSL